jgi:glucose dehydrogenase
VTGSYDPQQNLVFYGTGNPGPDYYSGAREGDNLYTASLVALDADTGELPGTISSRRTTSTTGTRPKCQSSPI